MSIGKPCRYPGCSAVVPLAESRECFGYCGKHKTEGGMFKELTKERLSFYQTKAWRQLRRIKLGRQPVCERCRVALATEVHHIENARGNEEGRLDLDNLQSLCHRCHSSETVGEINNRRRQKENGSRNY